MKFNRIMSAAIAACMSLTMFAGAANLDAAANSTEMETLKGSAHVLTPDGGHTTKEFEYTVPVNASEDEKNDIAIQAAEEAVGTKPASRSARATSYTLATASNFSIPKKSSSTGHALTASRKLSGTRGGELVVFINGVTGCSSLNVSLKQSTNSTGFWQSDLPVTSDTQVFFYQGGRYPNYTLYFDEGATVTTYFSGNAAGSARSVEVRYTQY